MIGRTVSHYKIIEKLGGGGMGVVYKAQDLKLDRPVALKFLWQHMEGEEHRKRFLNEAKAASVLDHPNICTIYEVGESEEGLMFLAMAFYEGETLKQKLERGPVSLEYFQHIAFQLLQGLSTAHSHGIVHRDIKPANVIITADDRVKIVDFGLARLTGEARITKSGVAVGTLAYMSPEQAIGAEVDHRTDIWSLAVVFYEMITGKLPFTGKSEHMVVQAILGSDPELIGALRRDVPGELDHILRKALMKTPTKRYGSVDEMKSDLEDLLLSSQRTKTVQIADSSHRSGPATSERRPLAIVICNLLGYNELIENFVPEETERVLRRIYNAGLAISERHGGIMNQFSGESMMFLFGLPASHEDDCVRMVQFTLEFRQAVQDLNQSMADRLPQPLSLQTGMANGLVIAEFLDEQKQRYRVTGNAVQIATLLATQADAEEILIAADCQRVISPYFETEERPPIVLKSKGQSVAVHRVLKESGIQTRLEAAERTGFTPFTGRVAELQELNEVYRVACEGEGQMISVVGEAGIGKSRLLHEFRNVIDLTNVLSLKGRCMSQRASTSYVPFVEALRELLDLQHQDAAMWETADILQRITNIHQSLHDFAPIYFHLLSHNANEHSLPAHLKGEDLRLAIAEAFSAIFTLASEKKPVILVLEDWHWADDASIDVLKHLGQMLSAYRILIVLTYRPEAEWSISALSNHHILSLTPLDSALSTRIIKYILDIDEFPEELGKTIHERTGGNPFFLEEICHTLVEEGIITVEDRRAALKGTLDQFRLPETVEAVIRTRLDRLNFEEQELIRVASVIGREFSRSVLHRMMADYSAPLRSLENLKTLGLIQQITVVPEATYRFKHALTLQVAYESLLPHRRKVLHGIAGSAIEEVYAARADEYADLLMYHFSQAEQWEKAVSFGKRAAERASKLGQYQESLELFQKVHTCLLKLPDSSRKSDWILENLLRQERLCETLGMRKRQQGIINEAKQILEAAGDSARMADIYRREGEFLTLQTRFDEAENALQKALEFSTATGDRTGQRNVLRSIGFLRWHEGKHVEAIKTNQEILVIDRELNEPRGIAQDLINLANTLRNIGEHEKALQHLEEALQIYEQHPDPLQQCPALHSIGTIYGDIGETEKALHYLTKASDLAARHHLYVNQTFDFIAMANIFWQLGKVEESLRLHRETLELSKKIRHADSLAQSYRNIGEILLTLGRDEEAVPNLLESARLFLKLGDREVELGARSSAARALERIGKQRQAIEEWQKVASLRKLAGDAAGELDALESIARISKLCEDPPDQILKIYELALAIAQEISDDAKAGSILNSMGILEWSREKYADALAYYEEALSLFEKKNDQVHAGLMLNSIGVTQIKLNRHEDSVRTLKRALEVNQQTGELLLEAHSWSALADAWCKIGDIAKAIECYEASLSIRRDLGDRRGEGWMLYHLARLFQSIDQKSKAEENLAVASGIARDCSDQKLLKVCRDFNGAGQGGSDAEIHH